MNNGLKYFLILILLLVLQLAIFNNISMGHGITVFIYIMFFLILPFRVPVWGILLLGFACGLMLDSIFNTGGIHAFSCVFIAYMRPKVLRIFEHSYDQETAFRPGIQSLGLSNFIKYTLGIVFIHNFVILFIEVFTLSLFFKNLFIVIVNTILTTFFCVVFEALLKKERSRQ